MMSMGPWPKEEQAEEEKNGERLAVDCLRRAFSSRAVVCLLV